MVRNEEGREHTVGCALKNFVPNASHREKIESAVNRLHRIVIFGTELCNLLLRRWLQNGEISKLAKLFNENFIRKIFNAVSVGKGKEAYYVELEDVNKVLKTHMGEFERPSRQGLAQCFGYEATALAATAKNNVWMHFTKRVGSYVRIYVDAHAQHLTNKEKKRLRQQMTLDMCRKPTDAFLSPPEQHSWIETQRRELHIEAVFIDDAKPLLYYLKSSPHLVLRAMATISMTRERSGSKAFALFPLRRTLTPRHIRFDRSCLERVLTAPSIKENMHIADGSDNRQQEEYEEADADTTSHVGTKKRKRRGFSISKMSDAEFFGCIVNIRACKLTQKRRIGFGFQFTTDGVCARVLFRRAPLPPIQNTATSNTSVFPRRGIWCIDELKAKHNAQRLHVVGVDPGKRELVVAVDMDDTHRGDTKIDKKGRQAVRYTQAQRMFETQCTTKQLHQRKESMPKHVLDAEKALCGENSRSACLDTFQAYVHARRKDLQACLEAYADDKLRQRRWKTSIRTQRSEALLYDRLRSLHSKGDSRNLVLAYGSWGLVAGRPGTACNKGNAPCIGVGLMRKLAKHFVVCLTPEAYTSKTCCSCLGECTSWKEMDEKRGKEVRGLRRCYNENCMIPLNRDRNGATNIGNNFKRLFAGELPIRELSDDDRELNDLALRCAQCG
jgi:hypothetical protein